MGYFLIAVIVIFTVGFFVLTSRIVFAGSISFLKNKAKSVPATVLNKRKQDMLRSSGVYTNYFILFDLGNGDRLEMPVGKWLYKKSPIGKKGILTYKGGLFISFKDIPEESPPKETYILNGEIVEK